MAAAFLDQGMQAPHIQRASVEYHRVTGVQSGFRFMASVGGFGDQEQFYREAVRALGFDDVVTLTSADPTPLGCVVALPTRGAVALKGSTALQWQRVAAHIAAGFRLQRKIGASGRVDATEGAEAILESNGDIAHATGEATPRSTRDALRSAAIAADRARGPLRRRAPEEAIETWRGLIAGRWTLVDHFDGDGRRYFVVHRNDPEAPDPRALTLRERQIVGYVALGQSNKLIAYELGLSPSTVAVHLQRASAKLGAQSRAAIAASVTPGSRAGR